VLYNRTNTNKSLLLLLLLSQVMVAQTAPAVRVAIGEEAGMAPGSISTGQMVAGVFASLFLILSAVLRRGGGGHMATRVS
jgi:iron only hydrogenase large subunit-like protein